MKNKAADEETTGKAREIKRGNMQKQRPRYIEPTEPEPAEIKGFQKID